ncbi:hypothetical protein [Nesterenkonia ebinurensis]|uniref:hypothetical protein n=1 Tax=Nesterenkonia ebinurensis TaxID=2608252 RepID=UPI00123DFEBE|nr:hypothetical protein [Nesterenkonia ebinurensis]
MTATITPTALTKATGLSLATLLALTACGGDDGEEAPPPEEVGDDNGAEESNGDDEEDTEPESPEDDEEEPPEASGEAPAFEDIYDDMMASMRSHENVTMHGEGSGMGMAQELGPGFEDVEDEATFTLEGAIGAQQTLWTIEFGDNTMQMLIMEDTGYISGDFFTRVLEIEAENQGMNFDASGYDADYGDSWIESNDFVDPEMHIDSFLDELDVDMSFGPQAPEGELGEHEGQEVWIYTEDEVEVAVLADESDPVLVYLIGEERGEYFEMHFTDWSSTDVPEEPEGDVISEEEMENILVDYLS